jgi:hypothetical protein
MMAFLIELEKHNPNRYTAYPPEITGHPNIASENITPRKSGD